MLKTSLVKLLTLATLLFSTALSAHTDLQSSVPTDGAKLSESPAELQLHFSKAVRLMRVSLEESERGEVKLAFMPGAVPEKDISLALPALEAGEYTVSWTIMGSDGHKMSGNFSFQVAAGK
ncbi:copper resistance CopC family protein [Microbulbifer marinus]|uniref:Copper resistance protein C n=1 Tax=Microbulbifer marinus TaxID=658218 RepID=A0A1H4BFG5_9GAMM|nr:copper resistance CopC family protein [Microbulbifer marinus]SEA46542.1 hypothetical protein SAMN05216562_3251 [Microbulbifer marinus]